MKTEITAHQVALSQPLRDYVEHKLVESIAACVENTATRLVICLTMHHTSSADAAMECRVHLHAPQVEPIIVHRSASDMYKAIDKTHDVLCELVHTSVHKSQDRHKSRVQAQKHRAGVARQALTTQADA